MILCLDSYIPFFVSLFCCYSYGGKNINRYNCLSVNVLIKCCNLQRTFLLKYRKSVFSLQKNNSRNESKKDYLGTAIRNGILLKL